MRREASSVKPLKTRTTDVSDSPRLYRSAGFSFFSCLTSSSSRSSFDERSSSIAGMSECVETLSASSRAPSSSVTSTCSYGTSFGVENSEYSSEPRRPSTALRSTLSRSCASKTLNSMP